MQIPKVGGFTLVELMVTLSIAAIVLALAVPSLRTLAPNARRTAIANDLVLALTYAKTEAVKRGVQVTVCSKASDTACTATTATSNISWAPGWLVFVDNTGTVGTVDASDLVLQVYPALPSGITLVTASRKWMTFKNNGFPVAVNNDTLRLCDSRGTAEGRGIVLSPQGRVRTASLASLSLTCP